MGSFFEEECLEALEAWIDVKYEPSNTRNFVEEKIVLDLVKKAFLDGFKLGRKQLNETNWELWNQK